MFRTFTCPSSGVLIYKVVSLPYVVLCPRCCGCGPTELVCSHVRCLSVSNWNNLVYKNSWRWACKCPKHVEAIYENKIIVKLFASSWYISLLIRMMHGHTYIKFGLEVRVNSAAVGRQDAQRGFTKHRLTFDARSVFRGGVAYRSAGRKMYSCIFSLTAVYSMLHSLARGNLFSWRYNPLWCYFHSPVADFSLLVFEVSRSHTTTRHIR